MKSKLKLLAVALIAGGTSFAATHVSIGVGIGGYGPGSYPPPAYATYQPPCPGPGYTWVDGYWNTSFGARSWVNGFWRAPVQPVRYVAPRAQFRDNDRFRDNRFDRRDDHRDNRNDFRSRDDHRSHR